MRTEFFKVKIREYVEVSGDLSTTGLAYLFLEKMNSKQLPIAFCHQIYNWVTKLLNLLYMNDKALVVNPVLFIVIIFDWRTNLTNSKYRFVDWFYK